MAKINIDKWKALLEAAREEQYKREEYFDNRSEKWQDSEKAVEYSDRTAELEGILDDLENDIDALESHLINS